MKVSQVMEILSKLDSNMEVAIEQIFHEHRSIQLRSVEIVNGCVVFKDHYVRVSEYNVFMSFDGKEFAVPNFPEKMN